jgi:uncharacterized protein YqgC (DUF456 family)
MEQVLLAIVVLLVMLIGLAGIFIPVLPGIELIWLAAFAYALLHGIAGSGLWSMIFLTVLFLIGLSSDLWITGLGMKATGTSFLSVFTGGCLLVIGTLVFTPLVGFLLWLGAILIIEGVRRRSVKRALASTGTVAAGCVLTYGVKFAAGVAMMGIWGLWVLRG